MPGAGNKGGGMGSNHLMGARFPFEMMKIVLYLDFGAGYMAFYICPNLSNCTLKGWLLLDTYYTSVYRQIQKESKNAFKRIQEWAAEILDLGKVQ